MFDFLKKPTHITIHRYWSSTFECEKKKAYLYYKWIPFRVLYLNEKRKNLFSQMFKLEYTCWAITDSNLEITKEVKEWIDAPYVSQRELKKKSRIPL